MAKQRIRRKDLKGPDEFVTMTTRAAAWFQANKRLTVGLATAVVVLLGVSAITSAFRAARARDANADLGRALAALQSDDLSAATQQLTETADRWGSSAPGQLASILAVNTLLRQGNTDGAVAGITRLLDSSAGLPGYLEQELRFSWGIALEGAEDWRPAAEKYAAAAAMSGPYRGAAILGEARARERQGNSEQAQALYRKYVEEFPDAPDADLVRAKTHL